MKLLEESSLDGGVKKAGSKIVYGVLPCMYRGWRMSIYIYLFFSAQNTFGKTHKKLAILVSAEEGN